MKRVFRLVHQLALDNAVRAVSELVVREEKPFIITIEPEQKKRTHDQNARMWGMLTNAALTCGTEAEDLHEIAKRKFLGFKEIEFEGTMLQIPHSTARLNTKQFVAYCDQLEAWLLREGLMQVW